MAETDTKRIPVATLEGFVARIFLAAGCPPDEAARVARYLVAANLAGHDSHGVVRVPRYVEMLATGGVFAGRTAEIVFENDAMAVVDGRMGLGQTVAPQAVEIGVAKARAGGAAVVALRNASATGPSWRPRRARSPSISSTPMAASWSRLSAAPSAASRPRLSASACRAPARTPWCSISRPLWWPRARRWSRPMAASPCRATR
jgi:uncharacterized oxidoreductase